MLIMKPKPRLDAGVDLSMPVKTRYGRAVRILCTDGPNQDFPVVGFIDRNSFPQIWKSDGTATWIGENHPSDLVN